MKIVVGNKAIKKLNESAEALVVTGFFCKPSSKNLTM